MNEQEYISKRANLQASNACIELKEKAITKLDEEYRSAHSFFKAINDFYEQMPDYDFEDDL